MSTAESVKVAVRVRPFNGREKEANSKCIIRMVGPVSAPFCWQAMPNHGCCAPKSSLKLSTPCLLHRLQVTKITNPETGEEKEFAFDYSVTLSQKASAYMYAHSCSAALLPYF